MVGEPSDPLDWVLVVLIACGVVAMMQAKTLIAAIVVTGVVGFGMTVWFLQLGATDVAITQLLVEILTVCVMVLLLRRLPSKFETTPPRKHVIPLLVAGGAGLATTVGVWALTGRREMSPASEYYLTEGYNETGGTNLVNTILVDFRALDTLGELTVLGVAGITIAALLRARKPSPERSANIQDHSPLIDARDNTVFVRTAAKLLAPIIVAGSLILLLRGHYEPGGGFIAALVGGAGFALAYLAAPTDRSARVQMPYLLLIGLGVAVGVGTGFLGYLDGSFLRPLHPEIFGFQATTALVFDVGVYLAVIGVILASFNLLGRPPKRGGQPLVGGSDPGAPTHESDVSDAPT
ncbi:hydrogen gas-evolving membrane-bound hydrogenase subunit E, partial [Kocuria atrinae]|uniref:hydrogen gas-evolving membrane-bound hydrogenase subunit E n=1 Tax=Kocuria atrinae TaxID=592377 RepID=UPI001CB9C3BF